jgi:hypothetical protein
MPFFWRGAPIGSYWHTNDARLTGFTPRFPSMPPTVNRVVQHIAMGTASSPFVSLSRSYAVAWAYAVLFSGGRATSSNPAYVYEVEIDPPLPRGLALLDPVQEIASVAHNPLRGCPYHHDGLPSFLLGVVGSGMGHYGMGHYLGQLPPCPPVGGATLRSYPANLTDELKTLVCALRDAEVLAVGTIPRTWITQRYDVP